MLDKQPNKHSKNPPHAHLCQARRPNLQCLSREAEKVNFPLVRVQAVQAVDVVDQQLGRQLAVDGCLLLCYKVSEWRCVHKGVEQALCQWKRWATANQPSEKHPCGHFLQITLTRALTWGSLFAGPDRSEMGVTVAARVAGICWIIGNVI